MQILSVIIRKLHNVPIEKSDGETCNVIDAVYN